MPAKYIALFFISFISLQSHSIPLYSFGFSNQLAVFKFYKVKDIGLFSEVIGKKLNLKYLIKKLMNYIII